MKGKVKSLLEYWWNADTIYRLHSPALYKIADQVFDNSDHYYDFDLLEQRYYTLLQNREIIKRDPFSSLRNQDGRILGEFAAKALHHPDELKKLYRLVRLYQPKRILELGSCLGLSTLCLSLASPSAHVIGVEGNEQFASIANSILKSQENTRILHSRFDQYLDSIQDDQFDFILLDGDHTYSSTIKMIQKLIPFLEESSIILMDDIHWSEGMYKAWKEISNWSEFSSSLETLRWGILFTDKSLTPGKYKLIPTAYKFWQKYL